MTKTTNCGDKMILGQAREGSFVYISVTFLLVTKFFLFLFFFFGSPHKDLHLSFKYTQKLSQSYTWRAEIAFTGLLSHPEHTSKLLPCNLSCATTVHGNFLINVARGVVVLHLMRRRQLLHISPFVLLLTYAKSTFFPL